MNIFSQYPRPAIGTKVQFLQNLTNIGGTRNAYSYSGTVERYTKTQCIIRHTNGNECRAYLATGLAVGSDRLTPTRVELVPAVVTVSNPEPYAILHKPDNGSTASVQENTGLGLLYIQVLDAYGFQREMTLIKNGDAFAYSSPYALKVYQHPGRRDTVYLTTEDAARLVAKVRGICATHPEILFNVPTQEMPRCFGFIRLCEQIHLGCLAISDVISAL